jgi:hypothetical protein
MHVRTTPPPFDTSAFSLSDALSPPDTAMVAQTLSTTPACGKEVRRRHRNNGRGGNTAVESVAAVAKKDVLVEEAASADAAGQSLTKAHVAHLSRSEEGSKYLQRLLLKGHPNVIKDVLDGIEAELPGLMCHTYGNYLCSAAFQACSVVQRRGMLEVALRHICALAKDKRGTHALQSLISFICTIEEQTLLVKFLRGNLVELCCDVHGTHVVQRAMLSLSLCPPCYDTLLVEVAGSLRTLAHHPYGVAVVKKCITQAKCGPGQQALLHEICCNAMDLVQGCYSNYVVQHAVETWGLNACWQLLIQLQGGLVQLSTQKFSSNVIEILVRLSAPDHMNMILEELTSPERAPLLMSTVYGHYVAASVLRVASLERAALFESVLASNLNTVKDRRLRAKWKEMLARVSAPR